MTNLTLKAAINQATSTEGTRAGTNQAKLLALLNDNKLTITDQGDKVQIDFVTESGDVEVFIVDSNLLKAIAIIDTLGAQSMLGIHQTLKIWGKGALNSFALRMLGQTIATSVCTKLDMLDLDAVKRSVYRRPTVQAILEAINGIQDKKHKPIVQSVIEPLLIDDEGKALIAESEALIAAAQESINALKGKLDGILSARALVVGNNGRIARVSAPAADISSIIGALAGAGLSMANPPQFSADFSTAELTLINVGT